MRFRLLLLTLLSAATAACTSPGPPAIDNTPPAVSLTAFNHSGNPVFRSAEPANAPVDACAHFPAFPAQFALSVNDAGGVRTISVHLFPGHFVPETVNVGPGAPESSWHITPSGSSSEDLTIDFSPPAPGTVRTSAFVVFDIAPVSSPPVALVAAAQDYHGNVGNLFQVDARLPDGAIRCRGDRATP